MNATESTNPNHPASGSLSEGIHEERVGQCRLLTVATPVDAVVSFAGSVRTNPGFGAGEEMLQAMLVNLLDKGTEKRDQFALADLLDSRGVELQFYSNGTYVQFVGRTLGSDLPLVLELTAEQLRRPLLAEAEFRKQQVQYASRLRRMMENTGSQASAALSRLIYGPAHPGWTADPAEDLLRVEDLTLDAVRDYHRRHLMPQDLTLVTVGDVDPAALQQPVEAAFGDWQGVAPEGRMDAMPLGTPAREVDIRMDDRENVDVRMGHGVPMLRTDPAFLPLFIGSFILGGNFSARLMRVIRDEMGLTYGIGAGLSGMSHLNGGHFQVAVTLSGDNLERGIEETRREVERFARDGVTAEELAEKQETITGGYQVGLGTTGGIATALLANALRGYDSTYIDEYVDAIRSVKLEEVNDAIRTFIHPDRLHVVRAGTLAPVVTAS